MKRPDTTFRCNKRTEQLLLGMLTGETKLSPKQIRKLIAHFVHCTRCQASISVLLAKIHENQQLMKSNDELAKVVVELEQFFERQRFREDFPEFIELWYTDGIEVAIAQFPLIADHIQVCQDCFEELSLSFDILQQSIADKVVEPPTSKHSHGSCWLPSQEYSRLLCALGRK